MRTIGLLSEHAPGEIPASVRDLAECPPVVAAARETKAAVTQLINTEGWHGNGC